MLHRLQWHGGQKDPERAASSFCGFPACKKPRTGCADCLPGQVFAPVGTNHINTGDMGVDLFWNSDADHALTELRVFENLFSGDFAGAQSFLVMVNVMRKALSARTRCRRPSARCFHPVAGMMRGTMSKGIKRSFPASSPYTAKVIPTR